MSKVMLVEDDNNLREIYEARLAAEGYEIISAADGEAALALAIKEKPDLIISDIMMPKVSGFDMLDILRSTTETKHTKIIMMTALNQAEDKAKAEKLGADLYLVKSQVTLEDVVRSAKDLLGEETPLTVGNVPVQAPANPTPEMPSNTTSLSADTPAVTIPSQPASPAPVAQTPTPQPVAPTPLQPTQVAAPVAPTEPQAVAPAPAPATVTPASQPEPQVTPVPTITTPNPANEIISATTTADEEDALQKQIEQYLTTDQPATTEAPVTTAKAEAIPQPTQVAAPVAPTEPQAVAPAPTQTPTTQAPLTTPQPSTPTPQPTAVPVTPQPAPIVDIAPAPAMPSSMAQPPSTLQANIPLVGDPNADRPAGEQVLVKSASADVATTEPGIDASVSGRKKVIEPINDIVNAPNNLEALAAKEGESEVASPALSAVVTPEGTTLSATNGTPTMNDIIAPNPIQAQQEASTPQQPLPPPVA
jgi:CheY-like chemotaxis protein